MPRKAESKRVRQGGKVKRRPVLPNHAYLQDRAAVANRCRVIREDPRLQDRAKGPPDDRWTWEKLTDPKTGEAVEGWSPDDTVPANGSTVVFQSTPEEDSAFLHDVSETLKELHETKVETYLRRQDERAQREEVKRNEATDAAEAEARGLQQPEGVKAVATKFQGDKSDYNTTLETFMENFCEPLRPELIKRLAKQLRDAHKNKTCKLPPPVGKPMRGQRHAHNAAVLMKAWPRLREHLPELPPLKPFTSKTISTGK